MNDSVISVNGLSKRYLLESHHSLATGDNSTEVKQHDFWALKDVSFELLKGDVLGIIGKNGAGKSTLLKILSGITPPSSGRVKIKGKFTSILEVGTGFHPDLTGRENVFLNANLLGVEKNVVRERFDEIVAFSEIEQFIDTPVKHYSSGWQQQSPFM
jgi:lipopolysaccharide transport system ATP-binding protein